MVRRLIYKLNSSGESEFFPIIVKEFLATRCQRACSILKCLDRINSGVPQGSILVSLLFLIYKNDLSTGKPFGSRYSRMDKVKFLKGCLPQILLDPFLNTLTHLNLGF